MGMKIEEIAGQETQTYLDETNPHAEAVQTAFDAHGATPTDETKKALKEAYGKYKDVVNTVKAAVTKNLETQKGKKAQAEADRAKLVDELKTQELTAPDGSLISKERLASIKEFALKERLTKAEADDMVKTEHQILAVHAAQDALSIEAKKQEYANLEAKNPKLGGANKTKADQLINALIELKFTPKAKEAWAKMKLIDPEIRESLLNIAEAMDPGELKIQENAADRKGSHPDEPWKDEFSKTAADAKKAGVGV